jgi:uncharacterized protein YidB (DUF937 family)
VLGEDGINTMAEKLGFPAVMVTTLAAQYLPQLIDHATPQGMVPAH